MGIARLDPDMDRADQLLRNADVAMYQAKAAGQGGHERYDPELHTELVQRSSSRPTCGGRWRPGAVPPLSADL